MQQKKKKKKRSLLLTNKTGTSSQHITNLKQSIFLRCLWIVPICDAVPKVPMKGTAGNTKGRSVTVLLTSYLTVLESAA